MDRIRVLAVDDEPFNLDLIDFAFADRSEMEITRAGDGREALAAIGPDYEPDVILLDLAMPEMNGFEVLKRLKGDPDLSRLPVIVITANGEERHNALKLGANDFQPKPFDVDELKLRTLNHAKLKEYSDYLRDANEVLEQKVAERTTELRAALELATETEREIAHRLGRAAEFRDLETGQHIQRMSAYSALIAEKAGLPEAEVDLILHAAPLHDIGKVGIPDSILLKPGKLRDDEYEIMQQHTTIGGRMLAGCEKYPLIDTGRTIALQHHEKYDGSGYPNGLAGEDIHLHGRIVAIADVFDALTSRRIYKAAMPLDETLALMRGESGRHFDPDLLTLLLDDVDAFLAIKERYPEAEEETPNILELIKGI